MDVALVAAPREMEEVESSEEELGLEPPIAEQEEDEDEEQEEQQRPSSEEPDDLSGSDGEDQYQSPSPPLAEMDLALSASTGSIAQVSSGPFKPGHSAPTPAVLGERDNNLRRSGRAKGGR